MKTRTTGFRPDEILFSPTTACNLSCAHCNVTRSAERLSARTARSFLTGARDAGVQRVGFTGGEPFLCLNFLCSVTRKAIEEELLFDRITTNGSWWRNQTELRAALKRLYRAGYDGTFCVSVDAFHARPPERVARFVGEALQCWDRPDLVSIARTVGARDRETKSLVRKTLALVKQQHPDANIRIIDVELAPVGRAARVKNPWDGRWFREDYCQGPGNVLFVLPDGDIKPCCGYANEHDVFTIGNIKRDTVADLVRAVKRNRFLHTVFTRGLSHIRQRLSHKGVKFPGKTTSHCFFCHHVLNEVPGSILKSCLAK